MRILVSGGNIPLVASYRAHCGGFIQPASGNQPERYHALGLPWACDNGCFLGLDAVAYERMLIRCAGVPGCLWAVVPDVVADHAATVAQWTAWAGRVAAYGYPLAFVAQNGATPATLPWADLAAVFIGGDTVWKLGATAAAIVQAARARGKWVHMGRVNTIRRLQYARAIGCDSVDGTGFSLYTDQKLPPAVAHLRTPRQFAFQEGVL